MIQRIQSIFLFMVVIISTVLFFVPFAGFTSPTGIYIQGLIGTCLIGQPGVEPNTCVNPTYHIAALNGVIGLIALVTIFLFRNRKRQVLLGNLNMLLIVAMIVLMFFSIDKNTAVLEAGVTLKPEYKIGAYLAIGMLICTFLANRYIKKDEELVRSADRIR